MLCVYTVLQCCSVDDGRWDSGSFAGRLSVVFLVCCSAPVYFQGIMVWEKSEWD